MKHRRPEGRDEAEAIGNLVGKLLEDAFVNLGLRGSGPGFASKIGSFATLLALWGRKTNLTADPSDPDEITFHVMDSLAPVWIAGMHPETALGRSLGKGRRMLDVGSGAGFPGLILAAATGIDTVLLESRRKRANFLDAAASAMDLPKVTIIQTRATPQNVPTGFDLVTVRAVGRPREFFELAAAALKPGGVAMVYLSVGQPVDKAFAEASGLVELPFAQYVIARGKGKINRELGLWLKEN
ncbi:MAG TPA: 16S rRNA (guanine(527)-N(7))-methyltransferase RsmG [Candidatus Binataceae bacterium]|nr:16S rRNA (guanine(527)-N(7))-methyltransferase RsmG [Candidatus Binataceae bacterium]